MTTALATARVLGIGVILLSIPAAGRAAEHRVLYAFRGGGDGAYPLAGLAIVGTKLYGTTSGGGSFGDGTVFALSSGGETVLHAFAGGSDGSTPTASLINMDGTLFGTTYLGGGSNGCPSGCGTVFSVSPATEAEAMVYAFKGFQNNDGAYPLSSLLALNGVLYGTTASGGAMYGTVFSIAPEAGAEVLLEDGGGEFPEAALVNVGGVLYGTSNNGGGSRNCGESGCGAAYSWNPSVGAPTTLYSFQNKPDGAYPEASLLYVGGTLYGTTFAGGSSGKGTVFAINLATGAERVLHAFKGGNDGAYPAANLIDVAGTLYGTTSQGGASASCTVAGGCGTVYSITVATGAERVFYAFQGGSDGQTPDAALLDMGGTLYGTTAYGGHVSNCSNGGCGTVFSLTP